MKRSSDVCDSGLSASHLPLEVLAHGFTFEFVENPLEELTSMPKYAEMLGFHRHGF